MARKAGAKGSAKKAKSRKIRDLSVRPMRGGDASTVKGGTFSKVKWEQ